MKTYVITISRFFPKTHKKAGNPTFFLEQINGLTKLHTIRGNYPLWKKRIQKVNNGDAILSLRYWNGKPYTSKQVEAFVFDKTSGLGVEKLDIIDFDNQGCHVVNSCFSAACQFPTKYLAENDGLGLEDFKEWFKGYDLSEPLAIIHFTHFRYNK
jgi:hypothetical protein